MQKENNKSVLITGSAGFIGYHLTNTLLKSGTPVIGIDNVSPYYDVSLKKSRLKNLKETSEKYSVPFENFQIDIDNIKELEDIFKGVNIKNKFFEKNPPSKVINLAAQAGVRHSIENPMAYAKSNLIGFLNILECCKNFSIEHLVYASSSSVYGGNKALPFNESNSVDHPVSFYAASKKANELMAHTYSHLYGLPTTGLRFFTVYGPWGRPDMALFLFTKAMIEDRPIKVFNNGNMIRDFTYIDDIVYSMIKIIDKIPTEDLNFDRENPSPNKSWAPYKVFNIGNSSPIKLLEYIEAIEDALGIKAKKIMMDMQPGDVEATISDTKSLENWINFRPNTPIENGIAEFIKWYKYFYKC